MVKRQIRRGIGITAILAGEVIAQKHVEARKGRAPRGGDKFPERNHTRQAQRQRWRMHFHIIFIQHGNTVQKDSLNRVLPGPNGQRKVRKRTKIRIQNQRGIGMRPREVTAVWQASLLPARRHIIQGLCPAEGPQI